MRRKKLIINALILTLTTMTLGFINMGFRVYISNKIGPEGMGLYQLIMSIYIMGTTIAISGIRVTTTRLIAEELGRSNTENIKTIMKKSLIYGLIFSLSIFAVIYNFAEFIGNNWIEDSRAIIPIKILACSLPFVSISACFHGYFYGMRKVVKSVSADIIELGTMLFIITYFLSFSLTKGLNFTCALISVGMTIGNIVSCLYFYILYIFEKKNGYKESYRSKKEYTLLKVASISIPIACSSYVQMGLKTAEDMLIPDALRRYGSSTSSSLAIFGMIKGMALPILYFPAIFLASFSTLIIPEIAEANALNQRKRVVYIISKVFKFTLLIAIFASGLFMIYSREFGVTLYNNVQVGTMMKILAPLIPFMYLDRVVDGSLNALDQQVSTLKFNIIDMFVRIVLIIYLIPRLGIEGFIIVLFVGTLLNSMLSINKLLKVTKIEFQIIDWIIKPCISIVLSSYLVKFSLASLPFNIHLAIQIVPILLFYILLLRVFNCIKKADILWFTDAFKNDIKGNLTDLSIYKSF